MHVKTYIVKFRKSDYTTSNVAVDTVDNGPFRVPPSDKQQSIVVDSIGTKLG